MRNQSLQISFFMVEFDRRLRQQGSQIMNDALHPGEVMTEIMRDMPAHSRLHVDPGEWPQVLGCKKLVSE